MYHLIRLAVIVLFLVLPAGLSLNLHAQSSTAAGIMISRIVINYDSVLIPGTSPKDFGIIVGGHLVLSRRGNDIGFDMPGDDKCRYRYQLEGFDKKFTAWQTNRFKEYTNLSAGHYRFRAEVIDNEGEQKAIEPVSFRVLPNWYSSSVAIVIYLLLIIILAWALYDQLNFRFARTQYMLEQIINTRTEELIIEKEKTEALLSNLLPKNTADEIMAKGKAAKIKYNFVTVLFSDIQGFTKIAEEMNPEVLIDELDKFFFHFDSVVEKYRIEKIKTIGDAYMCAGGIPEKNRTNPVEVILAALEMQQYMAKLKAITELEGMKFWDIRIGIHTGTIVAGVVGQKKLSYDIWGDTVNTASRMESSGEAGKINISGTTYEFVREFFICEHRGKMPVKYKGEIDMYFVNGIADGLRDEDGGPNERFILRMQKIKLQDIEEHVIKLFDEEAPPNLYFHNSALVRSLTTQVDLLSNAEQLGDEDFIRLRLASIFLYSGYIMEYDNAAEEACNLIEGILPKYGFSSSDVEETKKLVMNSFNRKVETISDSILCDSKYDYLGRVDYIKLTDKLLREETEYGKITDLNAWIRQQKQILTEHEFLTGTARLLRSVSTDEQAVCLNDFAKGLK
jgi:class 3 adenylate cyclase